MRDDVLLHEEPNNEANCTDDDSTKDVSRLPRILLTTPYETDDQKT